MIVERKTGSVIRSPERHVAFPVNREGLNDVGLPGAISRKFWPELASVRTAKLGEIITKDIGRKVFHALVVYSLEDGWSEAPRHIEACFNELKIPVDQEIASVVIGGDAVGARSGADPPANLAAMDRSDQYIVVYEKPTH